jgi:site-specific recombinase XerD
MLKKEENKIFYDEKQKLIKDITKTKLLIFPNQNGEMLQPGSYYTLIARAAKKAGIKASPHCLRHTFVYMTRETLSLKEIQAILGHDESTTTLDIYGDIINDSSSKVASKIDDIFSKVSLEVERVKEKEYEAKLAKVIPLKRAK